MNFTVVSAVAVHTSEALPIRPVRASKTRVVIFAPEIADRDFPGKHAG